MDQTLLPPSTREEAIAYLDKKYGPLVERLVQYNVEYSDDNKDPLVNNIAFIQSKFGSLQEFLQTVIDDRAVIELATSGNDGNSELASTSGTSDGGSSKKRKRGAVEIAYEYVISAFNGLVSILPSAKRQKVIETAPATTTTTSTTKMDERQSAAAVATGMAITLNAARATLAAKLERELLNIGNEPVAVLIHFLLRTLPKRTRSPDDTNRQQRQHLNIGTGYKVEIAKSEENCNCWMGYGYVTDHSSGGLQTLIAFEEEEETGSDHLSTKTFLLSTAWQLLRMPPMESHQLDERIVSRMVAALYGNGAIASDSSSSSASMQQHLVQQIEACNMFFDPAGSGRASKILPVLGKSAQLPLATVARLSTIPFDAADKQPTDLRCIDWEVLQRKDDITTHTHPASACLTRIAFQATVTADRTGASTNVQQRLPNRLRSELYTVSDKSRGVQGQYAAFIEATLSSTDFGRHEPLVLGNNYVHAVARTPTPLANDCMILYWPTYLSNTAENLKMFTKTLIDLPNQLFKYTFFIEMLNNSIALEKAAVAANDVAEQENQKRLRAEIEKFQAGLSKCFRWALVVGRKTEARLRGGIDPNLKPSELTVSQVTLPKEVATIAIPNKPSASAVFDWDYVVSSASSSLPPPDESDDIRGVMLVILMSDLLALHQHQALLSQFSQTLSQIMKLDSFMRVSNWSNLTPNSATKTIFSSKFPVFLTKPPLPIVYERMAVGPLVVQEEEEEEEEGEKETESARQPNAPPASAGAAATTTTTTTSTQEGGQQSDPAAATTKSNNSNGELGPVGVTRRTEDSNDDGDVEMAEAGQEEEEEEEGEGGGEEEEEEDEEGTRPPIDITNEPRELTEEEEREAAEFWIDIVKGRRQRNPARKEKYEAELKQLLQTKKTLRKGEEEIASQESERSQDDEEDAAELANVRRELGLASDESDEDVEYVDEEAREQAMRELEQRRGRRMVVEGDDSGDDDDDTGASDEPASPPRQRLPSPPPMTTSVVQTVPPLTVPDDAPPPPQVNVLQIRKRKNPPPTVPSAETTEATTPLPMPPPSASIPRYIYNRQLSLLEQERRRLLFVQQYGVRSVKIFTQASKDASTQIKEARERQQQQQPM